MDAPHVAGGTSTGSKRPAALFGPGPLGELPGAMVRSAGCRVWDAAGREYVDYVMALGAVALGYGHPDVVRAVADAAAQGGVGPLPPVLEEEVAALLAARVPWIERVRFLKTGAEAMAAAVRIARTHTGRDRVLGCGYHGWLDWCQTDAAGVPAEVRGLFAELPFNDGERTRDLIRARGDTLAAVAIEPIVVDQPRREWLDVVAEETRRAGAVLIVDEIKTGCRLGFGGGAERYGIRPDLVVFGKALANGMPLALVGGRADVMAAAERSWISSTLATEFVSLAAARAVLEVLERDRVFEHLARAGARLRAGLLALAERHPGAIAGVGGVAEMCFLRFTDDAASGRVARACARRGLLFKRSAYDFVSLAHDDATVDWSLAVIGDAVAEGLAG